MLARSIVYLSLITGLIWSDSISAGIMNACEICSFSSSSWTVPSGDGVGVAYQCNGGGGSNGAGAGVTCAAWLDMNNNLLGYTLSGMSGKLPGEKVYDPSAPTTLTSSYCIAKFQQSTSSSLCKYIIPNNWKVMRYPSRYNFSIYYVNGPHRCDYISSMQAVFIDYRQRCPDTTILSAAGCAQCFYALNPDG